MFRSDAINEILQKYKAVWALNHSSALMSWDLETYMPEGGARPRGEAQAQLALLRQKFVIDLRGLIERSDEAQDLNDSEKGVLRVLRRDLHYFTMVPPRLIEELQKVTTEATVVWRDARKKSSFSIFKPYLEKIVDLKRQEADKLGYERHPYNALADMYEEGITIDDLDRIFSMLVPSLKRILAKVERDGRFPQRDSLESKKYDAEAMKRVNDKLIEILGMPMNRFRMDVSTHPFTDTIAQDDVRITTRYEGRDFRATMFSVIHEAGHAIYELQVDEALGYTPLAGGVSSGVHESQSRFWENVLGRSEQFASLVLPILKKNLPFLSRFGSERVYRYFNMVRPSLIRVDADELTYNFHIALRYDIEKKLLDGKLSVSDLPALWNDTMQDYIGVKPKKDSEGVLQDIHWSGGSFGYFPCYSLGNVIAGMVWYSIEKEISLKDAIRRREFEMLKGWLKEKIHKWGSTYAPKDLQMRAFGEAYNPARFVSYLEDKFLG